MELTPLRVASIDVGTNAIRFLAVEFQDQVRYRVIAEARLPIRLGHGVFTDGRIEPAAAAATSDGLAQVSLTMKDLAVARYRAVATSAVRESTNRREFLRRVLERAGMRLEIISGSEEMRLVHAAVRRRMSLGGGTWTIVQLGGGSVEVATADSARVTWCETHAMGAVRLLELFAGAGKEPAEFVRLVQEHVSTIRLPERAAAGTAAGFIGTGGGIDTLARLRAGTGDTREPPRISRADLRTLITDLSRMPVEERIRVLGLRPDRADVIVPAAIVYEHLAGLFGAPEILVPGGGVREGIVFDLAESLARRQYPREKRPRGGAVRLGRKFHFDEAHARQVTRLALSLFDQLVEVHELGAGERRLLEAAALLHDVGSLVAYKGHHKHSLYIISHSELPGFTPADMALVGTIARYHRRGAPSHAHPGFVGLSRPDRDRVRKLSALLRIADVLDKDHRQKIESVEAAAVDHRVQIRVVGAEETLVEQQALREKDEVFSDAFGMTVTLATGGAARDP